MGTFRGINLHPNCHISIMRAMQQCDFCSEFLQRNLIRGRICLIIPRATSVSTSLVINFPLSPSHPAARQRARSGKVCAISENSFLCRPLLGGKTSRGDKKIAPRRAHWHGYKNSSQRATSFPPSLFLSFSYMHPYICTRGRSVLFLLNFGCYEREQKQRVKSSDYKC